MEAARGREPLLVVDVADPAWKTSHAHLEVTDGCPLNNMYRTFKHWIR
jgi:hypothetical protein